MSARERFTATSTTATVTEGITIAFHDAVAIDEVERYLEDAGFKVERVSTARLTISSIPAGGAYILVRKSPAKRKTGLECGTRRRT